MAFPPLARTRPSCEPITRLSQSRRSRPGPSRSRQPRWTPAAPRGRVVDWHEDPPRSGDAVVRCGPAAEPGHRALRPPGVPADRYRVRLREAPEIRGIPADDRRDHLRHERLIGDWIALAPREAQKLARRDLLLRRWPRLLPGSAASATHAVIRTAHAVRSLREAGAHQDPLLPDELAQGSATGRHATSNFPGNPGLAGPLDAAAATKGLHPLVPGCRRKVRESAVGSAHWRASSAYPAAWTGGVRQPARILLWMTSVRPPLGCRPPATACVFDQDPTGAGG